MFIGRTDVEAETPILWPHDAKSWLTWKDPDAGKDWGQEEKGTTEDEMVGWHHRLNGHGFGWTLGVGDGQGGLACWGSWGDSVRYDWPTELKWTDITKLWNNFGMPQLWNTTVILILSQLIYVHVCSAAIMSDSLQHHGLYPARLLCPWDYPGKNTGVGCHFLLQVISTQESNPHLLQVSFITEWFFTT